MTATCMFQISRTLVEQFLKIVEDGGEGVLSGDAASRARCSEAVFELNGTRDPCAEPPGLNFCGLHMIRVLFLDFAVCMVFLLRRGFSTHSMTSLVSSPSLGGRSAGSEVLSLTPKHRAIFLLVASISHCSGLYATMVIISRQCWREWARSRCIVRINWRKWPSIRVWKLGKEMTNA